MILQLPITRGRTSVELRPRFGRLAVSCLLFVTVLQFAISEPVGSAIFTVLESRFPPTKIGDGRMVTGIVVLGGGEERLREAGRLARSYAHLRVFVSGAGEASYVQQQLGADIAPQRIEIESRSRNTYENALFSRVDVRPQAGERWLLVTSATHMPRAMGVFRAVGFEVEPWPVRDVPKDDSGLPSHEMLGLAWYWLLGRSQALLPSP